MLQEKSPEDLSLPKEVNELQEGKSVTVDDTTYINPKKPDPCNKHYFEEDEPIDSKYLCCRCKYCGNGRIYDSTTDTIRRGKIVRL